MSIAASRGHAAGLTFLVLFGLITLDYLAKEGVLLRVEGLHRGVWRVSSKQTALELSCAESTLWSSGLLC
jgi:hypothetical protein